MIFPINTRFKIFDFPLHSNSCIIETKNKYYEKTY